MPMAYIPLVKSGRISGIAPKYVEEICRWRENQKHQKTPQDKGCMMSNHRSTVAQNELHLLLPSQFLKTTRW